MIRVKLMIRMVFDDSDDSDGFDEILLFGCFRMECDYSIGFPLIGLLKFNFSGVICWMEFDGIWIIDFRI